jgi:hypothetical protein
MMLKFVTILAVSFLTWQAQQGRPRPQTVLDGVFSLEQANKGVDDFEAYCTKCHEGVDPEGPILFGRTFIDRWREDNLDVLFNYIKNRMPLDRSGALSDTTNLQILAFLLHENGYTEGPRPLDEG